MRDIWRKYKSRARAIAAIGLTLSGWLLGTALPAQAAPSASLGVSVHILNPPNAITNLTAAPVGVTDGDVQLVWTAPSNQNGAAMDRYVVRFATFPAGNPAIAEAWWSSLGASQRTISPAHASGSVEFGLISGLPIGVTQYFGIKTFDVDGQVSPIDIRVGTAQQASSLPVNQGGGPPSAPAALTGTAQGTGSILWQWSASATASYYTLNAHPSGALITQTPLLQTTESGFTPNMAVTRTVRAGNGNGLSGPTAAQTTFTLAAVPATPAVTHLGFDGVDIGWNANGNPAGTLYRVERSLDNSNFLPMPPPTAATTFNDSGLTSLTSYYYRIRAVNGDGNQTAPSVTLTVFTPIDLMPPREPFGLKGTVNGNAFTLTWEPSSRNLDGSELTDLAGYHVYRSTSLSSPPVRLTTTPVAVPVFADQTNGQVYFYTVRAIDTHGNESDASLFADSSSEANVIFVAKDLMSSVRMPQDVNNLLRPGFNKYGVGLTLLLVEEPVLSDTTIIRNVRLQLVRGDTLEAVNDLSFPQSHATVSVGYSTINGEVARGGPAAAPELAPGITPSQLALYWSNGVSWIKLGGALNITNQTVSVKTAFLGNYQLRSTPKATSLSLDKTNVYPRIITPNGDGLNDRVYFVLENPNNVVVRGEIFDREGRLVATLADPSLVGGIGTTLIWDGHDSNGNVVPGGAYIYRIQGEGHTLSGTVGVAR